FFFFFFTDTPTSAIYTLSLYDALPIYVLGAPAEEAAYVGDSPFDMQSARHAGVYAVGVPWGGIHRREALADADVLVDDAEELLEIGRAPVRTPVTSLTGMPSSASQTRM